MTRFLRTIRHLKPGQVAWRVRYGFERWRNRRDGTDPERWRWKEPDPPRPAGHLPPLPIPRRPGPDPERTTKLLGRGLVEHLGRRAELDLESPDWRLGNPSTGRLWTMLLHCHGWAHALAVAAARGRPDAATSPEAPTGAAELFRRYVSSWIGSCGIERPGSAALAWNSYAIATRIGWWIRSLQRAREPLLAGHPALEADLLCSLWEQARYLEDHVEWDLRANHLLRDAGGLALAGRFFEGTEQGPEPAGWTRTAGTLAVDQAAEQILDDGVHFERSGRYHIDVMEDLATVWATSRDPGTRSELGAAWSRMAGVLPWLCHPDGRTHLLNDGSLEDVTRPGAVLQQGARLGLEAPIRSGNDGRTAEAPGAGAPAGGRLLADAGLAVWHGSPWTVFFDVGPVGPDYQPGHGHADTLTLECSFRGERLVVDPGTHGYDPDARRAYDRSTEAHNTVCVDEADSSEVWHIFRVGRRARPREVEADFTRGRAVVAALHDGYDHLPGRPRHRREVRIEDDGRLRVVDRVVGTGLHLLSGGFLAAPSWEATAGPGGWTLRHREEGHRVRLSLEGDRELSPFQETREYHPAHGVVARTSRLGWRRHGTLPARIVATFTAID